jgi:hypothetical protein
VDVEYVLNTISDKEIDILLKRNYERYKDEWEHTRMIASSMVGEVKLPWDKKDEVIKIDEGELERRKQNLIDILKKNEEI